MRPAAQRGARWALVLGALLLSLGDAAAVDAANPAAPARVPTVIVGDGSPFAQQLRKHLLLDRELVIASPRTATLLIALGDLTREQAERLLRLVRAGAKLLVLPGAQGLPKALGLTNNGWQDDRVTLLATAAAGRPLAEWVIWASAPQAARRLRISRRDLGWRVLVAERGGKGAIFLQRRLGRGQIVVTTLSLGHASNRELLLWPYFNYLLYVLRCQLTDQTPQRFGSWPAAPVPGLSALWILGLLLGGAWLITLWLFFRARRYSRAHPEVLETFFPSTPAAKEPSADDNTSTRRWASIGFARPLAGFLTLVASLALLFVPFYWLTNIVVPNDVQPFPQARGMWDFAWEALQMAWFLFDAGTFVAFVKYFAEYRVKDPKEAVRSAQFFVWWQILTGLVQVTLACVAAIVILPNTRYGYTSNFVILVALGQYPGFFGVVTFFFQAYQRFDYNIALDLLSDWVLRFVLLIPFVLLFRRWGAANPQYGEAFGAAVGIGIGYHVSSLVSFGLGVWLYRRLGLSLLPLFLAHFDRNTAKRMLWYGLRVVLGKFLYRAAQAIDKVMLSVLLFNYTEWLGLAGQINYNLMFLFPVAYRFFETSMAALSESYSSGKRTLTQYYVVRFWQVGSIYAAIGMSLLLALGPLFVHNVMDPQWRRAGDYLLIAGSMGALFAPAWLSDMLQKGSGRPGLFAAVLGLEQAARIGLFYLLIPSLQFWGFYLAIALTLLLKVIGAWIVNHLLILRLRLYFWQMFVAPLLAGLAAYGIWRTTAYVMAPESALATSVLFFSASLLGFPLCFFLVGLVGGYDHAFTDEFDQASTMTGPLRPLTRFFYYAARAGWSLSPLHARFPITIQQEAAREAEELQAQADAQLRPRTADAAAQAE